MSIHRRTSDGRFELYEQSSLWAMGKLEWDLESWLAENRQLLFPNDNVFIFGRQSRLGEAGIPDLLGFDEMGNLFVIELKRGLHRRDCIAQALDYVSELADWTYPQFCRVWEKHRKQANQTANLSEAHRTFQGLEEPLDEADFNRAQYIVIVSAGPDDRASKISNWLKNANVPIYYTSFEMYQSAGGADEFLIDVSPVEVPVAAEDTVLGQDFWLNSAEKHVPGSWLKMMEHGVACTYGPIEYGRKLQPLDEDSRVFLYVSQRGVVAEGVVKQPWSGKSNDDRLTTVEGTSMPEYSVRVHWHTIARERPQAVAAKEARAMGQKLFVPTLFRIDEGVAERLSKRLKEKTASV